MQKIQFEDLTVAQFVVDEPELNYRQESLPEEVAEEEEIVQEAVRDDEVDLEDVKIAAMNVAIEDILLEIVGAVDVAGNHH